MKNGNHNSSVVHYVESLNEVRKLAVMYRSLRQKIRASESSEWWPGPDRTTGRSEQAEFEINFGLKLAEDGELGYYLAVIGAINRKPVDLSELPIGALERYTELRRALADFIHQEGDWPTPNHVKGGSQMVAS